MEGGQGLLPTEEIKCTRAQRQRLTGGLGGMATGMAEPPAQQSLAGDPGVACVLHTVGATQVFMWGNSMIAVPFAEMTQLQSRCGDGVGGGLAEARRRLPQGVQIRGGWPGLG